MLKSYTLPIILVIKWDNIVCSALASDRAYCVLFYGYIDLNSHTF